MPFQPGNREGAKSRKAKPYTDALKLEIAAAGDNHAQLRKIARAHLKNCEDGDMSAIKELADRLDGKVPQAIIGDDESDPISLRTIVTGVARASDDQNPV